MAERDTLSGLTSEEAKAFHSLFVVSFLVFTAIACVAHFLVWIWQPWIPPAKSAQLIDGVQQAALTALPFLS